MKELGRLRSLSLAIVIALVAACDPYPVVTTTDPLAPTSTATGTSTGSPRESSQPLASASPNAPTTSWTKAFEIERGSLGDVVVGPKGLIAAGCVATANADCGRRVVVLSADGDVWQELEVDAPADIAFASLRRIGARLFALGYGHYGADGGAMVWTSVDGRAWSRIESSSFRGRAIEDIIDSPSGAFAVGYDAPIDSDNTSGFLLWPVHADGSFGSPSAVRTHDAQPLALGVVWSGEEFLAWGHDRRAGGPTTLLASPDGNAWADRAALSGLKTGLVAQIVPVGDRLVGVGHEGVQFPLSPRAWTSEDAGRSWELADVPASDGAMWTVGIEGSVLIARGNASPASNQRLVSWRSSDGSAWTRLPDDMAMPALPGFSAFMVATLGNRTCAAGTFFNEAPTRAAIYCRKTVIE